MKMNKAIGMLAGLRLLLMDGGPANAATFVTSPTITAPGRAERGTMSLLHRSH